MGGAVKPLQRPGWIHASVFFLVFFKGLGHTFRKSGRSFSLAHLERFNLAWLEVFKIQVKGTFVPRSGMSLLANIVTASARSFPSTRILFELVFFSPLDCNTDRVEHSSPAWPDLDSVFAWNLYLVT